MFKELLVLFFLISFINHLSAQTEILYTPDDANKEYSGITRWNNYIIVIPQRPADKKLYAFTVKNLQNAIKDSANGITKKPVAAQELIMHNMPDYKDGFEAAAVINNNIYFTIETDTTDNFCYVVKGGLNIEDNLITINFSNDKLKIPKPKNAYNMGFESLTYIKEKDSLFADFEFNKYTDKSTAFLIDKNLTAYSPLTYDSSLFFRITDINETDSNTIIAVNHYYNDAHLLSQDKAYKCEYRNYEIENNDVAKHQMHDSDATKTSFTRIIELHLHNRSISWNEDKVISYSNDNWEGILPFENGILMIVDGNRFTQCKLVYVHLK